MTCKPGIAATIPDASGSGKGFKRNWPPIIKMDETVKEKVEMLLIVVANYDLNSE